MVDSKWDSFPCPVDGSPARLMEFTTDCVTRGPPATVVRWQCANGCKNQSSQMPPALEVLFLKSENSAFREKLEELKAWKASFEERALLTKLLQTEVERNLARSERDAAYAENERIRKDFDTERRSHVKSDEWGRKGWEALQNLRDDLSSLVRASAPPQMKIGISIKGMPDVKVKF